MKDGIRYLDQKIRAEYAHVNFVLLGNMRQIFESGDYLDLARDVLYALKEKDFETVREVIEQFPLDFINNIEYPLETRVRIRNLYDACRVAVELVFSDSQPGSVQIPDDLSQFNPPWFN